MVLSRVTMLEEFSAKNYQKWWDNVGQGLKKHIWIIIQLVFNQWDNPNTIVAVSKFGVLLPISPLFTDYITKIVVYLSKNVPKFSLDRIVIHLVNIQKRPFLQFNEFILFFKI